MTNLETIIAAAQKESQDQTSLAAQNQTKYQEMSKRVNDEVAAHAATSRQLQAALGKVTTLEQQIATMAAHPDVKAAALKKALDNQRQANQQVAQIEAQIAAAAIPTAPQPAPATPK